ncbi:MULTISPECIES: hypothetical protein [Nocardia]|uniref:hypothetical protein n=1 Tax=Nocardia TaxID=1817 RepID=UPI000A64DBB8|nr:MULTISPECIES: hypothetical protein [Nocardia]
MTSTFAACAWDSCTQPATHLVEIEYPNQTHETWRVCRTHEKTVKFNVMRSRGSAPEPTGPSPTFTCRNCGHALERSATACPKCGSVDRIIGAGDTATWHESVTRRACPAPLARWEYKDTVGESFTRDINSWSELERHVDRVDDRYQEIITYYDGTRIESTAQESEH